MIAVPLSRIHTLFIEPILQETSKLKLDLKLKLKKKNSNFDDGNFGLNESLDQEKHFKNEIGRDTDYSNKSGRLNFLR